MGRTNQTQASSSTGGKRQPVGRRFNVGEVISKSTDILSKRPMIIFPQVLSVIPTLVIYIALYGSGLAVASLITLVAAIFAIITGVIVVGAYPLLVKEAIEGRQFTFRGAMKRAFHRFWSLLGAGILVGIIVIFGSIIVVPGLIFFTWYAYTVPAMMLEEKGALEGMSASRAFGRDKKWSTFLLFLVVGVVSITLYLLTAFIPLGRFIFLIFEVPLAAWGSVICSFTYISYGPLSATSPTPVSGQILLTQPSPVPMSGKPAYCLRCGTKLSGDEVFCKNCGTKL